MDKKERDLYTQYIRTNAKKMKMIIHKGGKCEDCGLLLTDKPPIADFHHLDPSQKDHHPGDALLFSWDNCVKELDKCVLLCTNCHRIRHYDWERFHKHKDEIAEAMKYVEDRQLVRVFDNEETIKEVLQLHNNGDFVRTISRKLGIERCSVNRILRNSGKTPNKFNAAEVLTVDISKEDLEKAANSGIGAKEIAEKFDCSKATIFNLLSKYKIKLKKSIKRSNENIEKSRQMLANGSTKEQVCQHFSISTTTLNRWLGNY